MSQASCSNERRRLLILSALQLNRVNICFGNKLAKAHAAHPRDPVPTTTLKQDRGHAGSRV